MLTLTGECDYISVCTKVWTVASYHPALHPIDLVSTSVHLTLVFDPT